MSCEAFILVGPRSRSQLRRLNDKTVEHVPAINFTFMHGFQNNLAQLVSLMSKNVM